MTEEYRIGFDRRYLALLLVPVLVYALYNWVLTQANVTEITFDTLSLAPQEEAPAPGGAAPAAADEGAVPAAGEQPPTASPAAEARARYLWISAYAVTVAVAVAVAISAGLSAWRNTPPGDRRLVFALPALGMAGFAAAEGCTACTGERWYTYLGHDLFTDLFAKPGSGVFRCLEGAECSPIVQLDAALSIAKFTGGLALMLLGLAFVMTLVHARGSREDAAGLLAKGAREQKMLLYQGAAVYVLACTALIAWAAWPVPFLTESSAAEYRDLMLGTLLLQGVGYTLGIASIYLPSAMALRQRALTLAEAETADTAEREKWLETRGFGTRPLDQLRQTGAMLLPVLVSLLPALQDLWG